MSVPDVVNGFYEIFAGLFILNNCRIVIKDKNVKGVSIISTVFFTTWGIWNLYYYPTLNQWASFYGGISVVGANMVWVILMMYYRRKEKNEKHI